MKKLILTLIIIAITCGISYPAFAYEPYFNYTFSKKNNQAQKEPQAYLPSMLITGKSIGIDSFSNPEDVCVAKDGKIYIADSGNDRIVILDKDFELFNIIDEFDNEGVSDSLDNPNGVFIADNNHIYVADTNNARIVVFNQDLEAVSYFGRPQSNLIVQSDFDYRPIKIAVDFAYRMFVISRNDNNGMIELASDGSFTGYFGSIKTPRRIFDIFNFTKEQKDRKTKNMPVEYSNVNVDDMGFIYATVSSYNADGSVNENVLVQRLNPTGIDVLKRNGYFSIMGDINYKYENNIPLLPQLTDIAVRDSGIYAILGRRTGRVYTYDDNGNLMYIFGGTGNNFGKFSMPVSIDVVDFDKYIVVDRNLNQLLLFEPTEYGSMITETARDFYNMEYDQAEEKYAQILKHTAKSDAAYIGMGRALFRKGNYSEAMNYFYLSEDRQGYSEAYKEYRAQILDKYFSQIAVAAILLTALIFAAGRIRKKRKGISDGKV